MLDPSADKFSQYDRHRNRAKNERCTRYGGGHHCPHGLLPVKNTQRIGEIAGPSLHVGGKGKCRHASAAHFASFDSRDNCEQVSDQRPDRDTKIVADGELDAVFFGQRPKSDDEQYKWHQQ
jgi:hypothetical protein